MTNPTQFKYLEAMGIPVWVSRELIIEKRAVVDAQIDVKDESLNARSSAEDLMEALDAQPLAPSTQEEIVSPVSSVAKVHSPISPIESSDHENNEIGRTLLHRLFASGDKEADWMVIGQSPDVNESIMYQPYPHESGELLNNMLKAVGIEKPREESYWLNILKSPQRVDNKEELTATIELNKLIHEQIHTVQPRIILLVGQLAAQNILQSKEPLARLRLQQHKQHLVINDIPVIVTYYPSYLLSKPQDKAKAWQDLKLAIACYRDVTNNKVSE